MKYYNIFRLFFVKQSPKSIPINGVRNGHMEHFGGNQDSQFYLRNLFEI